MFETIYSNIIKEARMGERYMAEPRPKAFAAITENLNLLNPDQMTRKEFIEHLFTFSADTNKELKELSQLFKAYELMLAQHRKDSPITNVEATIGETFQRYNLKKAEVSQDGNLVLIPRVNGGKIIEVSDTHGYLKGVAEAIAEFLEQPNNHFASLGDAINSGPEQWKEMKGLLKLALVYPDRVHLLKGNNEEDLPMGFGWAEELYKKTNYNDASVTVAKRSARVFKQCPLLIVTENGLVSVHGNLPASSVKNFQQLQESIVKNSRTTTRLLWGEKSKKGSKGVFDDAETHSLTGVTHIGEKGVLDALDALGGRVLTVGHQHSYARMFGEPLGHAGYMVDHGGRVATVVALANGKSQQGAFSIIPLDTPLTKLEDSMFHTIEYGK